MITANGLNLEAFIPSNDVPQFSCLKDDFRSGCRNVNQRHLKRSFKGAQLNLFITDTKGTGISVRIIEVSILEK